MLNDQLSSSSQCSCSCLVDPPSTPAGCKLRKKKRTPPSAIVDELLSRPSTQIDGFGLTSIASRAVCSRPVYPLLASLQHNLMKTYRADLGSSATNRSDTESSSNWKCGRRNAMALNTPGLALSSITSTRASRKGYCALMACEAVSSSVT